MGLTIKYDRLLGRIRESDAGGTSPADEARITALEDKYKLCVYYEIINSGTTGTVIPPTGGSIVLDQFYGKADAIITTVANAFTTWESAYTAGGDVVATTMDASGNYVFTDTPSAYPVCIIYFYKVKEIDFDWTKTIQEAVDYNATEVPLTFSDGLTRLLNNVTNNLITGLAGGQTVIGGTGVTDKLIYKGTTGNGTTTAIAHEFVGGNNGATSILKMYNDGNLGPVSIIGPGSGTNKSLRLLQNNGSTEAFSITDAGDGYVKTSMAIGDPTTTNAYTLIQQYTASAGYSAIYCKTASPSTTNYTLISNGNSTYLNAGNDVRTNIADVLKFIVTANYSINLKKFYIGDNVIPLALCHIAAGTATANTAPIKLTSGVNLTTPENGAIEYDGTNIYITIGGVRKTFVLV